MTTLLILLAIAYLLVGGVELLGIAVACITTGELLPSLVESLLIIVGWGWYEYLTWRRKHRGR